MSIERETLSSTAVDFGKQPLLITQSKYQQLLLGWQDLKEGFLLWRVWIMLAYQDILLRYRRSLLGPFWLTMSMAITVYTMGFLYSHLFHIEMQRYYPFLVAGMLAWTLISTLIIDCTEGLIFSDVFIKQVKLPYTLYIHRLAARNILIFFHNIIVIIPVLILFHQYAKVNLHTLLIIPDLFLIYINAISFGLILAMLGARYRDTSQFIKSLIQVVFFITPVLWAPEVLGDKHVYFVNLNPFYAFIELIRAPLLGTAPTISNLIMVAVISILGILISLRFFFRYRSRIVYWL